MVTEPKLYAESTVVQFLGRRLHVLDLSHELSPTIPVYPGHMKVAFWDHLTHAESRLRLGDTPFRGYAVKGMSLCDHDSTHVDAIYHFNPDRPDLTIDVFPIDYCFTDAIWVDVSDVPPGGYITLRRFRRAMEEARVERLPEGGSVLYYTGAATRWGRPLEFVKDFAGPRCAGVPLDPRPGCGERPHGRHLHGRRHRHVLPQPHGPCRVPGKSH